MFDAIEWVNYCSCIAVYAFFLSCSLRIVQLRSFDCIAFSLLDLCKLQIKISQDKFCLTTTLIQIVLIKVWSKSET